MEKIKYKRILIFLLVLSTLFLSIGVVCAEDVSNPEEEIITEIETSTEDNSKNTTVQSSTRPTKVSQANVINAAKGVASYADKNNKLPNFVTISGYRFSIPEFYYLMSKTISNKNKKSNAAITVRYNVKNPTKASGTWVRGNIYSFYYSQYANRIISHIDKNKRAPNFIKTAGGSRLQYQTNVYLFAKALSGTTTRLPYFVKIDMRAAHPINKYLPRYDRNKPTSILLGSGNLGHVRLIGPFGNASSKVRIAYILGMHPLESASHNALYRTLSTAKNLKYAYYVYQITVTKNPRHYYHGRMNGQLIAQKYVLPNIRLNKYRLVVDVHSNQGKRGGNYEKTNFIFAPLNHASSKTIADRLIRQIPGLSYYYPKSQTSPPYCTEPLVRSGIRTIVYETYLYESPSTTLKYIRQLVARVDKLAL